MILVLLVFLGNIRTAFIVALALPLSALISVICMKLYGISANLMSLGGIAIGIGMLGDGAIVMVENIFRHLNNPFSEFQDKISVVRSAAREVARPIAFSISIIILVFLPIFTLQGVEGKMFSPMAFTISFALLGSLAMALVVAPVLSHLLLCYKKTKENVIISGLKRIYSPLVSGAVRYRRTVAAVAVMAFVGSLFLLPLIGTEFIPTLEEGSILIGVTMAPSISLEKGTATILKMEKRITRYGEVIDNLYLNTRRFGIHLRFQEKYRSDLLGIENLLVPTLDGSVVPMSQVARVEQVTGPIQINRENNQRRWIVQGNIRGRDLGGVIADIRRIIENKIELPPGYYVEYGGQFANQQRAMARLAVIVPCVIVGVFMMLWMSFGMDRYVFIIILNVPLALIGGILGLYLTGEYLSVPASVGFIALFGIAVQNGVVLISYINQLRRRGVELEKAVLIGSMLRLRPVLMTAATTVLGLLPLLLAAGIGSEVQRPLATVVVYGLTSSTLLTLFVLPAVYQWMESNRESEFEV